MDASHALYLHAGSLATLDMLKNYVPKVEMDGDAVTSRRHSDDITPPGLWRPGLPEGTERVDFFTYLRWDAPSSVTLELGCLPRDKPYGSPGQIAAWSAHLFTPISPTKTIYFYSFSRDFAIGDDVVDAHVRATVLHAFYEEDKPMIEAQQKVMGTPDLMSLDPLLLKTDTAAVRVRRSLTNLISNEQDRQPVESRASEAVHA
jgi:vanillate O-demethylase monooxygenase subunit